MKKLLSVSTALSSLTKSNFQSITFQLFSSVVSTGSRKPSPLYKRISPLGDPGVSIVPVLDQWIRDGNSVDELTLREIIGDLKNYRRYKHALEVSQWMTDKRYIPLKSSDVAMRINLIFRVHGLEEVENYFSNIPKKLKLFSTHLALLNSYAHAKSVDKAEALMQKAKDMGHASTPMWYNIMMNLYCSLGNMEKLKCLMDEMEVKGIRPDRFNLTIRLKAYTLVSDYDGIESVVKLMQSDPQIIPDWGLYGYAATGYLKVGSTDKAFAMLQKMELAMGMGRNDLAMVALLQLYSRVGKKDEVYRIWKNYKEKNKVYNNVYRSMISSLMKLEDFDGVEITFKEWESSELSYDFRIVNYLIDIYCRKGNLEKAEALLNRGISRGVSPNVLTWCNLVGGYIMENDFAKAIDSLKKAISICSPQYTPGRLKTLSTCLEYLEAGNNMDEFIRSLSPICFQSSDVPNKLCCFIETGELPSHSGSRTEKTGDEDIVMNDELVN